MSTAATTNNNKKKANNDTLTKGRRTGVVMASPGKVPLDEDGMEDIDAFWESEKVLQDQDQEQLEDDKGEKVKQKKENNKVEHGITEPTFDVAGTTSNKMGDKKRYTALARRVLERQARQLERGALSPGAQSISTEVTELSATSMTGVSVTSPQVEVIGGTPSPAKSAKRTMTDDDMEVSSPAAGSLMSPITPGDVSVSVISEGNSFLGDRKSKKLDTLLENNDELEEMNDTSVKNPSKTTPTNIEETNFDYDDNYDDGYIENDTEDDNDEGNNEEHVSIIENEETPQKVREKRVREERRKLEAKKEKEKKKKKKKGTSSSGSVVSFSSPMSVYLPAGPREYDNVPVSDFKNKNNEDEEHGVRRSRRARFAPLQFWKNERVVYGPNDNPTTFGDMPVVATIQQAQPTPMKKIHRPKPGKKIAEMEESDGTKENVKRFSTKKFDKKKLNKNYNYVKGEEATVWDEGSREFSTQKIVAFASKMELVELPVPKKRSKNESKVSGKAVQAFNIPQATENIPGWISGNMVLPPQGIKDSENVGICSQVFFVGDCQPGSFEVAIANPEEDEFDPLTAQRFMLSEGDFFHVPPHNIYRVENHSETDDANLFWCIIRPTSS